MIRLDDMPEQVTQKAITLSPTLHEQDMLRSMLSICKDTTYSSRKYSIYTAVLYLPQYNIPMLLYAQENNKGIKTLYITDLTAENYIQWDEFIDTAMEHMSNYNAYIYQINALPRTLSNDISSKIKLWKESIIQKHTALKKNHDSIYTETQLWRKALKKTFGKNILQLSNKSGPIPTKLINELNKILAINTNNVHALTIGIREQRSRMLHKWVTEEEVEIFNTTNKLYDELLSALNRLYDKYALMQLHTTNDVATLMQGAPNSATLYSDIHKYILDIDTPLLFRIYNIHSIENYITELCIRIARRKCGVIHNVFQTIYASMYRDNIDIKATKKIEDALHKMVSAYNSIQDDAKMHNLTKDDANDTISIEYFIKHIQLDDMLIDDTAKKQLYSIYKSGAMSIVDIRNILSNLTAIGTSTRSGRIKKLKGAHDRYRYRFSINGTEYRLLFNYDKSGVIHITKCVTREDAY